jgi:hypothetical protein
MTSVHAFLRLRRASRAAFAFEAFGRGMFLMKSAREACGAATDQTLNEVGLHLVGLEASIRNCSPRESRESFAAWFTGLSAGFCSLPLEVAERSGELLAITCALGIGPWNDPRRRPAE